MSGVYAWEDVQVQVNGQPITGFLEGSKVRVTRMDDRVNVIDGTDGQSFFAVNFMTKGEIEITLSYKSPSNAILDDLEKNRTVVPFFLSDSRSGDEDSAEECMVAKRPDREWDDNPGPRVWLIRCLKLESKIRGNEVT